MNTTLKQTLSGVAVVIIAALLMGSYTTYTDISMNTEHRVSSVVEKKIDKLIGMQTKFSDELNAASKRQAEIHTNQKWLMREYKNNK